MYIAFTAMADMPAAQQTPLFSYLLRRKYLCLEGNCGGPDKLILIKSTQCIPLRHGYPFLFIKLFTRAIFVQFLTSTVNRRSVAKIKLSSRDTAELEVVIKLPDDIFRNNTCAPRAVRKKAESLSS